MIFKLVSQQFVLGPSSGTLTFAPWGLPAAQKATRLQWPNIQLWGLQPSSFCVSDFDFGSGFPASAFGLSSSAISISNATHGIVVCGGGAGMVLGGHQTFAICLRAANDKKQRKLAKVCHHISCQCAMHTLSAAPFFRSSRTPHPYHYHYHPHHPPFICRTGQVNEFSCGFSTFVFACLAIWQIKDRLIHEQTTNKLAQIGCRTGNGYLIKVLGFVTSPLLCLPFEFPR